MLYRGSEIMREVAWVVFDEVHYMRDKGTSLACVDLDCTRSLAPSVIAMVREGDVIHMYQSRTDLLFPSPTERGVVWEETIILLPHKVHYVFLSATIPNAMEFAEWICTTHSQPCHVVYTDYRPTPLQHYLFPAGGDGIHLVVDEKGVFREDNFQKAMGALSEGKGEDPANALGGKGKKGQTKKGGNKGALRSRTYGLRAWG